LPYRLPPVIAEHQTAYVQFNLNVGKDSVNVASEDRNTGMTPEDRFVEAMGLIAEGTNMPRTAGRIAGLLMLAEEPISFSEIARRLGVSRGNVSTNTRLLQRQGVIERAVVKGGRESYFTSSSQSPYRAILEHQFATNSAALAAINRTNEELSKPGSQVKARLARHRLFLESANRLVECQLALMAAYEEAASGESAQESAASAPSQANGA
jgi:DNA-binding transcriptional regulator GbsR (MarR family)